MIAPTRAAAALALIAVVGSGCRQPSPAPHRDAGGATTAARPCSPAAPCPSGDYCAYTPGLCGKGKHPGTCQPRPAACSDSGAPVCGCDGRVHESACAAHAAGVDLAVMGGCGHTVPGFAACGPRYCDARTSYCQIDLSDVLEPPTDHACLPLPPACLPDAGVARP